MKIVHQTDLQEERGAVALPFALARKYPQASREWGWQYVFPASGYYREEETGEWRKHHLHESAVQKALKRAIGLSGIVKPVHSPGEPSAVVYVQAEILR
ncbi:MAG: hypothetical protein O2782_07435 [bacterium]|nr:hypothetical protein [bacterium]